jgi:hypothetical protein
MPKKVPDPFSPPVVAEGRHAAVAPALRRIYEGLGAAAGALGSRYLRNVCWRMGDNLLRRWFGLMQWFGFFALLSVALLLAIEALRPELLAPSTSAQAATDSVVVPAEMGRWWITWKFWLRMASVVLSLWFMLRLARRVKCCCKFYLSEKGVVEKGVGNLFLLTF